MEKYKATAEAPISGSGSSGEDRADDKMGSGSTKSTYARPTSVAAYERGSARRNTTGTTRPVFIVGCPRSGTTLLHHMILSAGDFVLYPSESDTFAYLGAKYPHLTSLKDRKKLLEFFVHTERFAALGLNRNDFEARILKDCSNIGDFLRIMMEEMCRKQDVHRWVEKTPDHALYISEIKRSIPDALIVHIIRDGRDVSLSLAKYGVRRFLWQGNNQLLAFGALWKWMIQKGREGGQKVGPDYYELRYEDLVAKPRETLDQLGDFIGHDLDYDRILQVGFGSVTNPYTSFPSPASDFNPVGRWKKQYLPERLARFEALVGETLEELGYPLATPPQGRRRTFSTDALERFYVSQLETKLWIKSKTPFGRFVVRNRYQM
jgi:Sulfotransferase family